MTWTELNRAIAEAYGGEWNVAHIVDTQFNGDYNAFIKSNSVVQVVAKDGQTIGYDVLPNVNLSKGELANVGSATNSNTVGSLAGNGSAVIRKPFTIVEEGGKKTVSEILGISGQTPMKFISTEVLPAIAAAGVAITLGKEIDRALYNANPEFWDEKNLSTLNPDTWSSVTANLDDSGLEGIQKIAFNMIFGISEDGNTSQAYLDERALAYLTGYMQNNGVFDTGEKSSDISNLSQDVKQYLQGTYTLDSLTDKVIFDNGAIPIFTSNERTYRVNSGNPVFVTSILGDRGINYVISDNPCNIDIIRLNGQLVVNINMSSHNYNGKTYYAYRTYSGTTGNYTFKNTTKLSRDLPAVNNYLDLAYLYYNGNISSSTLLEGVSNQDNATIYNKNGVVATDVNSVLEALKAQYPELFANAITQTLEDGTTHTYVPIGTPNFTSLTDTQPTTDSSISGQSQNNTNVNTSAIPDSLLDALTKLLSPDLATNPTDTGDGTTPISPIPSGSASALYSVYNPTSEEVNALGAWLWSGDIGTQLLKMFNNPMESIIGLHKVFASPSIGGRANIKVGYIDSGVNSNYVNAQYTTIDCGKVDLPEYYGNTLDYLETKVNIYLPFIGIVPLNIDDIMRSTLSVKYHVDVLTGACLAEIYIQRDGLENALYTFNSNCSVQYPLSSGSYGSVIASTLSLAGTIGATIASGGTLAPLIGASAGALASSKASVQHSGTLSGNAGAMGIKKPYLIIERPQSYVADNFTKFFGIPENKYVTVGTLTGYTTFSGIHADNIPNATQNEKTMIETILKNGVIL